MRWASFFYGLIIAIAVLPIFYCGSRFVKKSDIQKISKDYEGVYMLREKIDIGNFDTLNKGAKIRIFFKTSNEYVSVYAYSYSQKREEAVGKNILQIFETDFPDKKFDEALFRQKLATMLQEYTGKLDLKQGAKDFDSSDIDRGIHPSESQDPSEHKRGGGRGGRGGGRRGR